jgi:hypothetical protein
MAVYIVDTVAKTRDAYRTIDHACQVARTRVQLGRSDRLEIRNALDEILGECRAIDRRGVRTVVTDGIVWRPPFVREVTVW